MNWLDAIFVIILVIGTVRGLLTGQLLPLLIIFAVWVTSIALAVNFEDQLGNAIGTTSWYPLLAFFIILIIVQLILYLSAVPAIILGFIGWRPQRWLDIFGGMLISGCITAIICGIIWRVLGEIATQLSPAESGAAKAFNDVVQGSALRSDLIAFVDWFEPPVGVVLGSVIAAALVLLATVGRIRGPESASESESESDNGTGSGSETMGQ